MSGQPNEDAGDLPAPWVPAALAACLREASRTDAAPGRVVVGGWAGPGATLAVAGLLLLGAAGLAACQRQAETELRLEPPGAGQPASGGAPGTAAGTAALPAVPASGADTSVPPAEAVLPAQAPAQTAPGAATGDAAGNQRGGITPGQASTAMPMPGQANDHSNLAGQPAPPGASAARPAAPQRP